MGVMRESKANLDGHISFIYSETEFCIKDAFDYGGLTFIGNSVDTPILNAANVRLINDAILNYKRNINPASESDISLFNSSIKYPRTNTMQSFNVKYGDTVLNLDTNEQIQLDGRNDIAYINRNFFYKIVSRPVEHPEQVSLNEFKAALAKVDAFKVGQFSGWQIVTEIPKKVKKDGINGWLTVEGQKYEWYNNSKYSAYYIIAPNGIIYYKHSSISAPFYDCLDILMGLVHSEYDHDNGKRYEHSIFECECSTDSFNLPKFIFKKFVEPTSYYYNNRLTHF